MKTSVLEKLKGSLLVDFNWQWIGVPLTGVQILLFERFKSIFDHYIKNKVNATVYQNLMNVYNYLTQEVSRVQDCLQVYHEIFEYMRTSVLSTNNTAIERTMNTYDYIFKFCSDEEIIAAASQRKIMKTISIVGRRLYAQRGHQALAWQVFNMIKAWAELYFDRQEKYPYIYDTYKKLCEKHGIVYPTLSPKHMPRLQVTIETKDGPFPSPKHSSPKRLPSFSMILSRNGSYNDDMDMSEDRSVADSDRSVTMTLLEYDDDDKLSIDFPFKSPSPSLPENSLRKSESLADSHDKTSSKDKERKKRTDSGQDKANYHQDKEIAQELLGEDTSHSLAKRALESESQIVIGNQKNSPKKELSQPKEQFNSSFKSHYSDEQPSLISESTLDPSFSMEEVYVDTDRILISQTSSHASMSQYAMGFMNKSSNLMVETIKENDFDDDSDLEDINREISSVSSNSILSYNQLCDIEDYIQTYNKITNNPNEIDPDESLFKFLSKAATPEYRPNVLKRYNTNADDMIAYQHIDRQLSTGTLSTCAWELGTNEYSPKISSSIRDIYTSGNLSVSIANHGSNQVKSPITSPLNSSQSRIPKTIFAKKSFHQQSPNQEISQANKSNNPVELTTKDSENGPQTSTPHNESPIATNEKPKTPPGVVRKGSKIPMLEKGNRSISLRHSTSMSFSNKPTDRSMSLRLSNTTPLSDEVEKSLVRSPSRSDNRKTTRNTGPSKSPANGSSESANSLKSSRSSLEKGSSIPIRTNKSPSNTNTASSVAHVNNTDRGLNSSISPKPSPPPPLDSPTKSPIRSPSKQLSGRASSSSGKSSLGKESPTKKKSFKVSHYPTHSL